MGGRVCLFVYWFTVYRHGLTAIAMKRVVFSTMKEVKALEFSYCHCEEGAERPTRQSIVSRGLDGNAVRLLRASGSPRAFGPRDDKGGWVCGEKRKNGQSLYFTLHPSIFTLLLLAFLETNTEACVVAAGTGGVGGALS
jgi:hypothetical protein